MAEAASYSAEDDGPRELDRPISRPLYQSISLALMLPREHGAWAMLLMPFLLGATAGRARWPALLLLVSVLFLFTASRPMELALQGRSGAMARVVAYAAVGSAAGSALLLVYGRWMLLPIGAAAGLVLSAQLILRRMRLDRTWPARLASIAALSATGPAAFYTATGTLDERALAVWALCFLYSGASVFYVRLFYHQPDKQKRKSPLESRLRAERQMIAYVAVAFGAAAALAVARLAPPLGLAALLPLALKVVLGCRRRDSRASLRQIGFAELGHSTLFLVLASVSMLVW